ncbi:hypothetical protein EYR38_001655 [Pleurotus pulmonarius]|nr:hypothetical protein EYR38_001655 [Pleurotus pulmonarius]
MVCGAIALIRLLSIDPTLAVANCNIPEFGTAIRPSAVTIGLRGYAPYFDFFTWIKDCIYRLPFPNSIRTLVFDIDNVYNIYDSAHGLYPDTSDYMFVSQFLQQLHECGELRDVVLNIKGTAEVGSADDELHLDEARELSKLQTGFEPLLRANVLKVDFTLVRFYTATFEPIMHCKVGST